MATRIIAGVVLGLLFLLLILQSEPWILLIFGAVQLVAQYEFSGLLPGISRGYRLLWAGVSLLLWGAAYFALRQEAAAGTAVVTLVLLAVLFAVWEITRYARGGASRANAPIPLMAFALCAIALPFALIAAIARQSSELPYLLLLIGPAWAADTAGVFSGKYFGSRPLIPRVSPKKTIEGAVGGVLAGGLAWLATALLWKLPPATAPGIDYSWPLLTIYFLLGAGIAASGICGDLAFSLFKRLAGVKDYGTVIPGHGGVLDRFDAMLFAAPLVYLFILAS